VYGKPLDQVPIPEGEKRAESNWFREPLPGDRHLQVSGSVIELTPYEQIATADKRRIILEPKPKPPARVWLVREGTEMAARLCFGLGNGRDVYGTATQLPLDGPDVTFRQDLVQPAALMEEQK
jgi:hypothetical protein